MGEPNKRSKRIHKKGDARSPPAEYPGASTVVEGNRDVDLNNKTRPRTNKKSFVGFEGRIFKGIFWGWGGRKQHLQWNLVSAAVKGAIGCGEEHPLVTTARFCEPGRAPVSGLGLSHTQAVAFVLWQANLKLSRITPLLQHLHGPFTFTRHFHPAAFCDPQNIYVWYVLLTPINSEKTTLQEIALSRANSRLGRSTHHPLVNSLVLFSSWQTSAIPSSSFSLACFNNIESIEDDL